MSPARTILLAGMDRQGAPSRCSVPEISRFFGIVVVLWPNDHPPPHFHASYEGLDVAIDIRTSRVLEGRLRPRAMNLVLEWADLHRDELLVAWNDVRRGVAPGRIAPLE
jgi:Domain of unknown function (DUF4160)